MIRFVLFFILWNLYKFERENLNLISEEFIGFTILWIINYLFLKIQKMLFKKYN